MITNKKMVAAMMIIKILIKLKQLELEVLMYQRIYWIVVHPKKTYYKLYPWLPIHPNEQVRTTTLSTTHPMQHSNNHPKNFQTQRSV